MCAWREFGIFHKRRACPVLVFSGRDLAGFLEQFAAVIELAEGFEGVCYYAEDLAYEGAAEDGRGSMVDEGRAES
jgi:hypothetical protein